MIKNGIRKVSKFAKMPPPPEFRGHYNKEFDAKIDELQKLLDQLLNLKVTFNDEADNFEKVLDAGSEDVFPGERLNTEPVDSNL